ncbi:MAG: hypothetical protein GF411_08535 [Candidatus Lokiarchaeota archaeon]|nr:hypothetical protein [Candidatus Lokiarchaeota archaeon]
MPEEQLSFDFEMQNAKNDVPWMRSGSPFSNKYSYGWGNSIVNIVKRHRIKSDEQLVEQAKTYLPPPMQVIEERSFAEMWDYYCNGSHIKILDYIFSDIEDIKGRFTLQERYFAECVAQSLIQWLGTTCGSCFVDECRRLTKIRKDELMEKIDPEYVEKRKIDEELSRKSRIEHDRMLHNKATRYDEIKDEYEMMKKEWNRLTNKLEIIESRMNYLYEFMDQELDRRMERRTRHSLETLRRSGLRELDI